MMVNALSIRWSFTKKARVGRAIQSNLNDECLLLPSRVPLGTTLAKLYNIGSERDHFALEIPFYI